MISPLGSLFDALSAQWVATAAPDDGSGLPYKEIATLGEEGGAGQHRQFIFAVPRKANPGHTSGSGTHVVGHVEWVCSADLFLHFGGRTQGVCARAIPNDIITLVNSLEQLAANGIAGGVSELVHDGVDVAPAIDGIRATFRFRVFCEEGP